MGYRRRHRTYYRRSRRHYNNGSVGDGLSRVAAAGVVGAIKACISADRAIHRAGRIVTLPYRVGRGIYRTFKH